MTNPRSAAARDAAGAAAFAFACLVVLLLQPVSHEAGVTHSPDVAAFTLLALATLPLALRRRHPVLVAAVVVPASIAGGLAGYALNTTAIGALFALASAAYLTDRRRSIAMGTVAAGGLLIGLLVAGDGLASLQSVIANLLTPVLAVLVGDVMRGRREYAQRWESRAREIEELRKVDQQRAVASERVRVAREVHDIVGHHLAAITVQARAGQRAVAADPGRARNALADIDALAGTALADTRGALARITEQNEPAPRHPVVAV